MQSLFNGCHQQELCRVQLLIHERVHFIHQYELSISCTFSSMNLNKENIKERAIIFIAWAIALSLVLLVFEKFKLLLPK